MADQLKPGTVQDGYKFIGGDPAEQRNWEPVGLPVGTVQDGYKFMGGDPSNKSNWADTQNRTWGEVATDTGVGLVKGVLGVAKLVPMAVGASDTLLEHWMGLNGPTASGGALNNPVTKWLQSGDDWLDGFKSEAIKTRESESSEKAEKLGANYKDSLVIPGGVLTDGKDIPLGQVLVEMGGKIGNAVRDPSLLLQGVSENVASVTPAGAAGRVAQKGTAAVLESTATKLTREAIEKTAARVGTAASVATGATQQGADTASDTFSRVMALDADQWKNNERYNELAKDIGPDRAKLQVAGEIATEAGFKAGVESLIVNGIGAKFGGQTIEKAFMRRPVTGAATEAAAGSTFKGAALGAVKGALGEATTEALEEGYGQYAQNQGVAKVNPEQDLFQGVGTAAGQGAITAGVMGGGTGAFEGAIESLHSKQRQLAEVQLQQAKSAADAAAAANILAGSVDELERNLNQLNALPTDNTGGIPAPTPTPRAAGSEDLRDMVDRETELLHTANTAGFEADRRNALEQAEVNRGAPRPLSTEGILDLTPMDERQAAARLAVMRDMTAREGGNSLELAIIPHPSQPGKFAIGRQALPNLNLEQSTETVTPEEAQRRLDAAAAEGQRATRNAFFQPTEAVTDEIQRGIERDQGVATPGAAQALGQNQIGVPQTRNYGQEITPYDSVSPAPETGTIEVPTTPTNLNADAQRTASLAAENNASMAAQAERARSQQAARDQATEAAIDQSNAPRQAPDVGEVIRALQTPPAQRDAGQVATVRQAQTDIAPGDMEILQKAATAPMLLSATDKIRLGEMRQTQASPQGVVKTQQSTGPVETPLMGERVARALGLPSNGTIVSTDAKFSSQRTPAPGMTETVNDQDEQGNPVQHQLTVVDVSKLGSAYKLLQQIARMFGKRVVAFTSDTLAADGFVRNGDTKNIYINAKSQMSPLAVLGHELLHILKQEAPAAYRALATVVARNLDQAGRAGFRADYGRGASLEELTADLMGNQFQDPEFWGQVFNEIAAQNPGSARGIILKVAASLTKAINAFRQVVQNPQFKAEQFIKDADAVKAAIKQAVTAYAQQQRGASAQLDQESRTQPAPRAPFQYSPDMQGQKGEPQGVPIIGTDERVLASRRRADFTNPEDRLEVSTTSPKPAPAKGRTSNSYDEKWVIDGEDVRASKKHVAAVNDAIRAYNTLTGKGNASKVLQELHDVVVENLLWLHDMVPAAVRERAKLWYDGANRIANDWTSKYGISLRQSSGVLAVLSPQMDWFKNVSLGERVISIYKDRQNEPWSQGMTDWMQSWVNASKDVETKASRQAIFDEAKGLQGMTLSEMTPRQAALYVRAFDEAYYERQYRLVTPEGGFGEYVTKNDDDESSVTWGGFDTIQKAIEILDDGSFRNIDAQLGNEHKVRNFYNNIISPNSADGHVTIDTHAVAAALVKALSGSSQEVKDNFGAAGGNAETGAGGTYGLFADAYRDAAAKRGILPREMQSITWEAVRALFPAASKKQLAPQVDAIWDRFKKGQLTREEAREQVKELSGGIRQMAWEGSDEGSAAADGGTSFDHDLDPNPAKRAVRLLPPEVAKDKISVTLSPNTSTIPGIAELQAAAQNGDRMAHKLLQDIALDNLQHLLAGTSAKIKAEGAVGLYGGYAETSLSMTVSFADNERAQVLAALAKFAENFNQEQVHVRSGTKEKVGAQFDDGSYATPSYRIDLKRALSQKEVQKIIDESGLFGLTFGDDFIEAYYVGDFNEQGFANFEQGVETATRLVGTAAAKSGRTVTRLWPYGRGVGTIGFERIRGDVSAGPAVSSQTAKRVAEYLNARKGEDGKLQPGKVKTFEQEAEVTPKQAALQNRIATIYESLPDNDLKNPNVRKAYQELAKEVIRQFKALPIKVEVMNGNGEPYANSAAMRRDILDNNHLFIFGTTPETFGPPGEDFTGHPLLGETGLKDQNGYPLLYNDLLRAVHDYYAHAMAPTQFGAKGEEAAWKNHMSMTSNPWARWALTSETRGQNSWVNFRSDLDQNTPAAERPFARQKAVLLPVEYTLTGNRNVDAPMKEFIAKLGERAQQGTKPAPAAKPVKADPVAIADRSAQDEGIKFSRRRGEDPEKTVTAYKLFRVDERQPGKLFPLFVDANKPVEQGVWLDADIGEAAKDGKVKSKIGPLAFRPGWHAGDLPIATHIGAKSQPGLTAPDIRPANHVWAEVEMAADRDWQTEADKRGTNAQGKLVPVKAHITDQVPVDGYYRYKTNPNMTGNWLIGGSMKVNRILSDDEVQKINVKAGVADLPRAEPFNADKYGFAKLSRQRRLFTDVQPVTDEQGRLLAPNGRVSNLSEDLWYQVRSPEFKDWFGDWEKDPANASRVVDENGEPMIVYHGTRSGGFTIFNTPGGRQRGDIAIFASDNRQMARSYVRTNRSDDLRFSGELTLKDLEDRGLFIHRAEDGTWGVVSNADDLLDVADSPDQLLKSQAVKDWIAENGTKDMPGIYPVFMNIRDGLEVDAEGSNWNEVPGYGSTDNVGREATDMGMDGAIVRDVVDDGGGASGYAGEPSTIYMVFDPNNVKSAGSNIGTFSKTNDDIRFSRQRKMAEMSPSYVFGKEIAPLAIRAYKTLSSDAKAAVDGWNVNWHIGSLTKAFAENTPLAQEIRDAFAPVREKIRSIYGDTIKMYRGEQHEDKASPDSRTLYSWTPVPGLATRYAMNWTRDLPKRITDEQIDEAVANYEKRGFTTFAPLNNMKFKQSDYDTTENYYWMYDRYRSVITDGSDLREFLKKEQADRDEWIQNLRDRGNLFVADVPVDKLVWTPTGVNLTHPEIIAEYNPRRDPAEKVNFSRQRQTETPEFKRWFGDSKVVDENGDPLVVYHGTPMSFDEFNTFPIFFTDDAEAAAGYAHGQYAPPEVDAGPNVMPVYLSMQNPKTFTAKQLHALIPADEDDVNSIEWSDFDNLADELEAEGYDGVIIKGVADYAGGKGGGRQWRAYTQYVAFNPTQIKSATGNNGQFDPSNPDITQSRQRIVGDSHRQYTNEQKQMFERVGRTVDVPTIKERIAELRKDLGKKLAQGIADQFMPLKELSKEAYALARLSKGAAGAFEAFLHHGRLKLTDGVYDADTTGGFVERLGVPLHGELEDFMWWVASNRAQRLTAEGRENLFSAADIAAGKSLDNGTTDFDYTLQHGPEAGKVTRDRTKIYRDALITFNEFNKNAMDMAEQSGLIDAESRQYWEHEFYVPFYRISDEDGAFVGGKVSNQLIRQRAFQKLKGGSEKLNSDLLANTLQNWAHLIDAAAKNRAAKAALETAAKVGVATETREGGKGTVWFMDNGKQKHFEVSDPYVMAAITSLEYAGMKGPLMNALSAMKHVLTIGVTASPAFKIRNLIRDSVQAVATADLSYNVAGNVAQGFKATKRDSQDYVSMLASGALIRFGSMEGSKANNTRRLIRAGIDESTILDSEEKIKAFYAKAKKVVDAYNELGNRGEEINRAALYKQLIAKGMSHQEASLAARDLMDFSMQGTWSTVRFLTQVVPFLNARIQGLYKLGKSAHEDPKRFSIVLGAVALASIALMAAYSDDDDWKKREDWDRNNNWWFKFGGVAFRIPKPFEIGAIATLAERGVEYFTSPEMTGKRLGKNVMAILADNLSLNPVPQAVKPILDLYSNKDSFTGRPIETMGMERVDPQYRYTQNTSMVARGLSTATLGALSPVQFDHVIRGYFGWLGTFVVSGADYAIRPMTSEASRPAPDYWKVATAGFVSELPADQSRYVTQMYEQAKEMQQAYATYKSLKKQGRLDEARDYYEEHVDEIKRHKIAGKATKAEAKLNERIRMIERSNLDPDEKRARIRVLNERKSAIAERTVGRLQPQQD